MISIRCSSLPRVMACPASLQPGDPPFKSGGKAADLGSAAHWAFSAIVRGRDCDLGEIARVYKVEVEELTPIYWQMKKQWEGLAAHFPSPISEMPLGYVDEDNGIRLSGTPDLFAYDGDTLRVLDAKTGWLDGDWSDQVAGYAFLAMIASGEQIQEINTQVLRTREGTLDGRTYNRRELWSWYADLVSAVQDGQTYNPGPRCGYCPRGHSCPAKTRLIEQAWHGLAGDFAGALPSDPELRGPILGRLLERARLVEKTAETVRAMVKADVLAHGGALPLGNGQELRITETERKSIDYPKGWLIVLDSSWDATTDEVAACLSVSKSKVESLVKKYAPPRQGAKRIRELHEALAEAGAFTSTFIQKLEVRKCSETETAVVSQKSNRLAAPLTIPTVEQ